MALDFTDLLGSMIQSGMSSSTGSRVSSAGGGIQDLLGNLMGGGQSVLSRAGQAVGGGDNLAATGIGALLGALTGRSSSTTLNSVGGGLMGLLGMMAYKALTSSSAKDLASSATDAVKKYTQQTPQQQSNDAEIILTAMIDAAKSDGQVDSDELSKIMGNLKNTGVGQEGLNFIISKLQAPMETSKILAAVKGRPDLAVQVYSASLMAIEVDTQAERNYLDKLAKSMGLSSEVVRNIEQMSGVSA
mgnify:CR=1 FL=1